MGERPARPGLGGCVGDALFACEVRRIDPAVDSSFWLARAIHAFNARGSGPTLHHGLAGLGFVLAVHADAEDHLAKIDRALLGSLASLPPASMQGGLAGLALYASLRSGAESGQRLQQHIVETFAAAARRTDGGLVWDTPVAYARSRGIDVHGELVTELGMVHGISGALVALSALAAQGQSGAAALAQAGLRAAWTFERPGPNRFGRVEFGPHGADGTREFDDRRWCVADPGILRALWVTATTLGDTEFAERALGYLREDAAHDAAGALPGEGGRIDLCCGCGIVAQVYRRMYLETGDTVFLAAKDRLLGVCADRVTQLASHGFTYGRAGVLLALLAGDDTQDDSVWDAMLGVSLPKKLAALA